MSCVWMLQRGHSGDGCVLASTLCTYDLRKVGVCGNVCCVVAVVKNSVFLALEC